MFKALVVLVFEEFSHIYIIEIITAKHKQEHTHNTEKPFLKKVQIAREIDCNDPNRSQRNSD